MSTREIVIAGFGGQGVMSIGKLLAEGAMKENKHSSWLPSYGPEMRGGTANCHVVISDDPIISPIINHPTDLLALNEPSYVKFQPDVIDSGNIFINYQLFDSQDGGLFKVETKQDLRTNMVMLGAFNEITKVLQHETLLNLIKGQYTGSALESNIKSYESGVSLFRGVR
ncbi:MAG TPA: 2-oxoacid:ferredoxin oxidoreductase subunit gamma [Erysipelothrix sp.]|jgi:2-oxoglutarate ferredoxin oxidoreductase subunit gamma|nr:2-oxoacid:ferredoxin oxidoreductase subunit gamma [Erysipelothrix sp.]